MVLGNALGPVNKSHPHRLRGVEHGLVLKELHLDHQSGFQAAETVITQDAVFHLLKTVSSLVDRATVASGIFLLFVF